MSDLISMLRDLDSSLIMARGYSDLELVGPSVIELAIERIEDLERDNMEIKLNEVEVQKLNLQPGEVLVVTVKSDLIEVSSLHNLGEGLRNLFPNNKVAVLSVEPEGSIDLTVVNESK